MIKTTSMEVYPETLDKIKKVREIVHDKSVYMKIPDIVKIIMSESPEEMSIKVKKGIMTEISEEGIL